MNKEEYMKRFAEPIRYENQTQTKESDSRAGRALAYAMDIRKFEIELYWKRATYFWTFIGAAFAAYALTYKTASEHEPWLSLLFSVLGFMFSFSWYLVNRGSKFWQNNWERHVDLLEDMALGPLYKIIAEDTSSKNPLTAAGSFSVTKINQILSLFVTATWIVLVIKSIFPLSLSLPIDFFKVAIVFFALIFSFLIYKYGRSANTKTKTKLHEREIDIQT